jgi:hypothetical protein
VHKFLALVVVALGAILVIKTLTAVWLLCLLLALALGVGTASGAVGRWGYTAAVILALLAIPGFLFKTLFASLILVLKLGPILLVLFGLYLFLKALS